MSRIFLLKQGFFYQYKEVSFCEEVLIASLLINVTKKCVEERYSAQTNRSCIVHFYFGKWTYIFTNYFQVPVGLEDFPS